MTEHHEAAASSAPVEAGAMIIGAVALVLLVLAAAFVLWALNSSMPPIDVATAPPA